MPYQIDTVEDLVRILQEHPEWRERVREVLLTEEERQLPELVRELSTAVRELVQSLQLALARIDRLEESHQQAIARLDRLEESHQRLWESHQQAIARLDRLEESHQRLWESHQRLWESHQQLQESHNRLVESHNRLVESVQQLWESQREVIQRLTTLEETVRKMLVVQEGLVRDVAELKGEMMELKFEKRAPSIFGPYLRRVRPLIVGEFVEDLREEGHDLTDEEWVQLFSADAIVYARHPETREELYLLVEISWVVHADDVERAVERAGLLRRCGRNAYPAVYGKGIHPDAVELVDYKKVLTVIGNVLHTKGFLA